MKNLLFKSAFLALGALAAVGGTARAQDGSIQGTYQAVLTHEQTNFYQFANITLRTVNPGNGTLKISANVRIFYGDRNSNEFLTYEYPDVPMNLITRQVSLKTDNNDVAFIGYLKDGEISGEWYSSVVGRVGTFDAKKSSAPAIPSGGSLVRPITGRYQGRLTNTNPASSLPERMAMALVTTQDNTNAGTVLKISGNLRFYLGGFDSSEYIEAKLTDVQFNFYSRYLTVKTQDYGITMKGYLGQDGTFTGDVFADGLGQVGKAQLKEVP